MTNLKELNEQNYNGESFIGFWGVKKDETVNAILIEVELREVSNGKVVFSDYCKKSFDFWVPKSVIKDKCAHYQGNMDFYMIDKWFESKLIEKYNEVEYVYVSSYYNNIDSLHRNLEQILSKLN